MKIISNKTQIREFAQNKKNLGFVPTMGGIHEGHISLMKRSVKECDFSIVSIFINKQQFNKKSDFLKYPRILKKDIKKIKKLKIDVLYLPKDKEIYPGGYNRKIKISQLKKRLCGKFRPGHFEGVVDVIDRFIKIINPKKIYLGKKDLQQLKIIEDFLSKHHPMCKVVPCKIIRERSGIAMSSRNYLLTNHEKKIASKIFHFIKNNKRNFIKKRITPKKIKNNVIKFGARKIDYIELLNINKLTKPFKKNTNFRIFIAYYLRKTRLIDNI